MKRTLMRGLALLAVAVITVASTCGQKDPNIADPGEPTQLVIAARDGNDEPVTGVEILLDGASVGTTPLTVDVTPGSHEVQLAEAEGFYANPVAISVVVANGESMVADFSYREGFPRTVLLEDFTNAGCGPCVPFEEQLLGEISGYTIDELVQVSVHHRTPGFDPMHFANPSELFARGRYYYNIAGTPSVATDGAITSTVPPNVDLIIDDIEAQLRKRSPISLDVSADVVGTNLEVEVVLDALADVPGNTRLVVLSLQDHIVYDAPPGTNGESEFHHVVRDFEPDLDEESIEGAPIDIQADARTTYSFTLPLIQDGNPPDDPDESRCVVFVQDWDTQVVHQAASTFD